MGADVHPRESDQNRDWEAQKFEASARDKQNAKERRRRAGVSRWKRVIFRTEARAAPTGVGMHRWACPRKTAFNHSACSAGQQHRQQHGEENTRPFSTAAAPREAKENESNDRVQRPIAEQADVAHKIPYRGVLMVHQETAHAVIEMKRHCDRGRRDCNSNEPIQNSVALHK